MINKLRNLMKTSLKAPQVKDPEVQRAIEKIYDDLNKLIDGVKNTKGSVTEEYDGEPGDIRLVKAKSGVYTLEAKGDEGWVSAVLNGIPIAYTSVGSRTKEIGSYQDFTGATGAQGEQGIQGNQGPQGPPGATGAQGIAGFTDPDFDSGWIDLDRQNASKRNYEFSHNLNFTDGAPRVIMAWYKDLYGDKNGAAATGYIYPWKRFTHDTGDWRGGDWRLDDNNLYVHCYSNYWVHWNYQDDTGGAGDHKYWNRIAGRILIWE